jgi:hypothetical protein
MIEALGVFSCVVLFVLEYISQLGLLLRVAESGGNDGLSSVNGACPLWVVEAHLTNDQSILPP